MKAKNNHPSETPSHNALMLYMSDLSEEAYSASWMDGLEFVLWKAVIEGPCTYGRLDITQEHIEVLQTLSKLAKGWIVHNDTEEFIELDQWINRYESEIKSIKE